MPEHPHPHPHPSPSPYRAGSPRRMLGAGGKGGWGWRAQRRAGPRALTRGRTTPERKGAPTAAPLALAALVFSRREP